MFQLATTSAIYSFAYFDHYISRFKKGLHDSSITMFHVVFALKSSAVFSVAKCYHELSKAIGIGIRYEER
jgi:hypothetical protein